MPFSLSRDTVEGLTKQVGPLWSGKLQSQLETAIEEMLADDCREILPDLNSVGRIARRCGKIARELKELDPHTQTVLHRQIGEELVADTFRSYHDRLRELSSNWRRRSGRQQYPRAIARLNLTVDVVRILGDAGLKIGKTSGGKLEEVLTLVLGEAGYACPRGGLRPVLFEAVDIVRKEKRLPPGRTPS